MIISHFLGANNFPSGAEAAGLMTARSLSANIYLQSRVGAELGGGGGAGH